MARGIVIFGANGCGKTTLGHELAYILNFTHMDAEDYYFEKSDVFYANPRSKDEVISLMISNIEKHGSFVLSSVTGNYGEEIVSLFDLAVLLSAPKELRMERIRNRAIDKHGKRALPGGDMYEDRERFVNFARARDLSIIDDWAKSLICPIIRLDATEPMLQNIMKILEYYPAL